MVGGGDGAHRGGSAQPGQAGAEPASARLRRQRDRRGRHHRGRARPLPDQGDEHSQLPRLGQPRGARLFPAPRRRGGGPSPSASVGVRGGGENCLRDEAADARGSGGLAALLHADVGDHGVLGLQDGGDSGLYRRAGAVDAGASEPALRQLRPVGALPAGRQPEFCVRDDRGQRQRRRPPSRAR